MRFRDWMAPLGILLGAFGIAGVAAAATSSSSKGDDKKKKNGGDATKTADAGGKSATVTRRVKKGGVATMTHTGLSDSKAWTKARYATSVSYLTGLGLDDQTARKMSLAGLAHWAIETGSGDLSTAGSHEYNFNVGGIHARDGDAYFESTDAGVKTKFASYDSAEDGIADYWALLAADYSSCLKQMKDDAASDAWIRCLGQKGYYGGSVDTVATGWTLRRSELAKDAGFTGIHGDEGDRHHEGEPVRILKGTAYWLGSYGHREPDGRTTETHECSVISNDGNWVHLNVPGGRVIWVLDEDIISISGDDSSRTFGPYSQDAMNELLTRVRSTGMNITGSNPWTLDPGQHGIKLEADYDHDSGNLVVKVISKNFYVSNAQIWSKLAPLMPAGDRVFGDIDDERDE